jgi:hypothetical protein
MLMVIDTEQERRINIGQDYKYPPLRRGECIIHEQMKNEGFKIGQTITIEAYINKLYRALIDRYNKDYAPIIG